MLFLQLRTSHHSHWTVLFWLSLFPQQTSRHPHKRLAPPPASRAQGTQEVPLFPATAPVGPSMALHLLAAWWHQQRSLAVGCPLRSRPLFHRLVAWALRLREVPPRVDSWGSRLLPWMLAARGTAPAARPQGPQSLLKGTCQHRRHSVFDHTEYAMSVFYHISFCKERDVVTLTLYWWGNCYSTKAMKALETLNESSTVEGKISHFWIQRSLVYRGGYILKPPHDKQNLRNRLFNFSTFKCMLQPHNPSLHSF